MNIGGMNFAVLDIIFIVIILIITIKASLRGFVEEFFSKAAVIGGGILAILFYKEFTPILESYSSFKTLSPIISFLILFLCTYIIIKILQMIVGKFFESDSLASFDKALGFFLGLIESLVIILIILFLLKIQTFFDVDVILNQSLIAKFLIPFVLHDFSFVYLSIKVFYYV